VRARSVVVAGMLWSGAAALKGLKVAVVRQPRQQEHLLGAGGGAGGVLETDTNIEITILMELDKGEVDCQGNPWHPIAVELTAALGQRRVFDATSQHQSNDSGHLCTATSPTAEHLSPRASRHERRFRPARRVHGGLASLGL